MVRDTQTRLQSDGADIERMCRAKLRKTKAHLRRERRTRIFMILLTALLISWACMAIMAIQLVRISKAAEQEETEAARQQADEYVVGRQQAREVAAGQERGVAPAQQDTEVNRPMPGIVHLAGIDTDQIWSLRRDEADRLRDDLAKAQEGALAKESPGLDKYIGEFEVTYYCCERYPHICGTGDGLTATGIPVRPGIVAVDPEVIPLGSTVVIDEVEYLAADTGSGIQGSRIDIAVETHAEALELGRQTKEVFIYEIEP